MAFSPQFNTVHSKFKWGQRATDIKEVRPKTVIIEPDVMAHICDYSTRETEAGGSIVNNKVLLNCYTLNSESALIEYDFLLKTE